MSDAPTFDLQSHSLCSDGELPPAEVVARAASEGVRLLALTDHDTVEGVDEAIAAAREHNIKLVPAVEISALDAGHQDLHVLGYRLDHHDPELLRRLADYRRDRANRSRLMVERLRELGFALEERALAERGAADQPIGRPHIAAAAFRHPDNTERLRAEGLGDASALLAAYLVPGAPAYVAREFPTVEDAIAVIHAAGGVAVWAHPFWNVAEQDEVLAAIHRYRASGVDGVEAFYPMHTREQTLAIATRCAALGLLTTGSADFHGPSHGLFSRFRAFELQGCEPSLGPISGDPADGR